MIRFALFGAGRAGRIHARNLARHSRAELACIFDVDRPAADRLAVEHGARSEPDAGAIRAAGSIDAVVIASSTHTHVDLLREALHAGKAAYCEKPIDFDLSRVRAVVAEAAGTEVPVAVGFRRRCLAEYQEIRRRVQDGEIGAIEAVHLVSRDYRPPPPAYLEVSGGFLRDKTIHYFDLVPWLVGERPAEVYAAGACLVDPRIREVGDIDTAMVLLRMPSGALCHIENGRRAVYGFDERVEVFGARGMLRSQPPSISRVAGFGASGIRYERYPDLYGEESFAGLLDAFVTALESGQPVGPSLAEGLQARIIAEAAVESLRRNRPVAIEY